jgi:hypothetical protein
LLFLGHHGGTEVVVNWNADGPCGVVLVDGRIAASVQPGPHDREVSAEGAAELLDLAWLKTELQRLLGVVEGLEAAVKPKRGRKAYRSPHSRSTRGPGSLQSQFEIYTSQCAWAGVEERKLAALPCPLCGEPMILSAPAAMKERLVCPVCTRTQHSSAALMISLVVDRLRDTFKLASSRLAPEARAEFGGSIELLEQLQEALGGPSSEE